MIRKEGYPAEAHVVLTDDGYLLTMHRIPAANVNSPTVFLQHGLLASSSDWVIAGKNRALGIFSLLTMFCFLFGDFKILLFFF